MDDLISRQMAIDAINGLVDRFERILRDIRETNGDDSVCGMCEYDGAYIGQSGDWCNECPGFDKEDCFKLSDECRKRWLKSADLPSAQPIEPRIIRCKDCKHWTDKNGGLCDIWDHYISNEEFFCGCGERRKIDGTD